MYFKHGAKLALVARNTTKLEEVAEEQLRESKMGLKPKPFKTIG